MHQFPYALAASASRKVQNSLFILHFCLYLVFLGNKHLKLKGLAVPLIQIYLILLKYIAFGNA